MQMKISATINRLVDKQDSSVKAYASVTIDGMFAVHGLRVMETEKGRFVNMPQLHTQTVTATNSIRTFFTQSQNRREMRLIRLF